MRNERLFDLVVWIFIFVAGLAAADLCFGILSSQANGKFEQYTVGGAIAGALISWGVLTSVYLQLRGSSDELRDLRRQNSELQGKLIRGAPRPKGFDIEVDERQRIVLARPKDWEPKGGIIFQLELADEKMKPGDIFAATFMCSFVPIENDPTQTREQFYANQIKWFDYMVQSGYAQSYSQEVMRVGGDVAGVESLKIIARQVARVETRIDPARLRPQRTWAPVPWVEFAGWIRDLNPSFVYTGRPAVITLGGTGFHKDAVCYVNKKKRSTVVKSPYLATVTLENEDVTAPANLEIHIENPEAAGKPSNSVWLSVMNAFLWPTTPDPVTAEAKSAPSINSPLPEAPSAQPQPQENAGAPSAESTKPEAPPVAGAKPDEPTVTFVEIVSMHVYCYQESLEKAFYFGFWDDAHDFLDSSDEFNRILASTRFLS